jgi:hypothetical protein
MRILSPEKQLADVKPIFDVCNYCTKRMVRNLLPLGFLLLDEEGPLAELSEAGEWSLFRDSFLTTAFLLLAAFLSDRSASNSESSSAGLLAAGGA